MKPRDVVLRSGRQHNYQDTYLGREREPDFVGKDGSLWRVLPHNVTEWDNVTLGLWFVAAPQLHPFYDYYVGTLIHLREIQGVPPPFKVSAECEYDFAFFALDPEYPVPNLDYVARRDASNGPQIHTSIETEFMVQFPPVGGDEHAVSIIDVSLQTILRGETIPDTDWRVQWSHAILQKVLEYTQKPSGTVN